MARRSDDHQGQPQPQDSEVSRFVRQVLQRNGISLGRGLGNTGGLVKPVRLQPRYQEPPGPPEEAGLHPSAAGGTRPRTASSDMPGAASQVSMLKIGTSFSSQGLQQHRGQWTQPVMDPYSAIAQRQLQQQQQTVLIQQQQQQPPPPQEQQQQQHQFRAALTEEEEEDEPEVALPIDHTPGMVIIHVLDAQNKAKRNFRSDACLFPPMHRHLHAYIQVAQIRLTPLRPLRPGTVASVRCWRRR